MTPLEGISVSRGVLVIGAVVWPDVPGYEYESIFPVLGVPLPGGIPPVDVA